MASTSQWTSGKGGVGCHKLCVRLEKQLSNKLPLSRKFLTNCTENCTDKFCGLSLIWDGMYYTLDFHNTGNTECKRVNCRRCTPRNILETRIASQHSKLGDCISKIGIFRLKLITKNAAFIFGCFLCEFIEEKLHKI